MCIRDSIVFALYFSLDFSVSDTYAWRDALLCQRRSSFRQLTRPSFSTLSSCFIFAQDAKNKKKWQKYTRKRPDFRKPKEVTNRFHDKTSEKVTTGWRVYVGTVLKSEPVREPADAVVNLSLIHISTIQGCMQNIIWFCLNLRLLSFAIENTLDKT